MINQIKTALEDGACESVTIIHESPEIVSPVSIGRPVDLGFWQSIQIKSFTVNLRKFDELNVGDLVATPNRGEKRILSNDSDSICGKYLVDGFVSYHRHQLVLLERAEA